MKLRICHLYPDLLNIYGDRGNLIALKKRAALRAIDVEIHPLSLGEKFIPASYDLLFLGGGQDSQQRLIHDDLRTDKGKAIREAIEDSMVCLCICGGFQLMGRSYVDGDGRLIEGLAVLDMVTEAGAERFTGDILTTARLDGHEESYKLIGFENHAGRSYLGKGLQPLGKVVYGKGNNGTDGGEGCRYRNLFATYMHGSFLPKNPRMTDLLMELALRRRYPEMEQLTEIDDRWENLAREAILNSPRRS